MHSNPSRRCDSAIDRVEVNVSDTAARASCIATLDKSPKRPGTAASCEFGSIYRGATRSTSDSYRATV